MSSPLHQMPALGAWAYKHPHLYAMSKWLKKTGMVPMPLIYLFDIIFLMMLIGITTLPEGVNAFRVNPSELILAGIHTIGHLFSLMVVNAGVAAKPLVEPLLWISAFFWALLSIATCLWAWRYLLRKFG